MRSFLKTLVAMGMATLLALVLTSCGQVETDDSDDPVDEAVEATEESEDEEASLDPDAPIAGLNGWWKVCGARDEVNDAELMDEELIDDFVDTYHTTSVFKVDAAKRTFEMGTFTLALYGTIDENPTDGWFSLRADAGAGLYSPDATLRCRLEDDGNLTLRLELPPLDDEPDVRNVVSYSCGRSDELESLSVETSVFDYTYDTYMEFRDANEDLPITWYAEPKVIAENDSAVMLLWGTGETDDSYILMTGVVNKLDFPMLVANSYTERSFVANGDTQIAVEQGCYLIAGQADQAFDFPIAVKKSDIAGELRTLSGTLELTTISLGEVDTLDFGIEL